MALGVGALMLMQVFITSEESQGWFHQQGYSSPSFRKEVTLLVISVGIALSWTRRHEKRDNIVQAIEEELSLWLKN